MSANDLLSITSEFTSAEGQPTPEELEAVQRAIFTATPEEKGLLLKKLEGSRNKLELVEDRVLSAETKKTDIHESTAKENDSLTRHNVGMPGILARRRDALRNQESLGEASAANETAQTLNNAKPDATPESVQAKQLEELPEMKSGGLVGFEEIGPDGELRVVERPTDGDITTFEAPVKSDNPAVTLGDKKGILGTIHPAQSVIAETPKTESAAPPVVADNASRAKDAVSGPPVAGQREVGPKIDPGLPPQTDEGIGASENIDANRDNIAGMEALSDQKVEATTAEASKAAGALKEAPIVTVDKTPDPTILAQTGGDPTETPTPKTEQTDMAASTLPPEDDPYAVKIRRPLVSEDQDEEEVQDSTVYPANKNREPADVDNNVDGPVSEIQRRIQESNATFDHEVESVRAERAGSAIAPEPKVPWVQAPASPEATVTVDGKGPIREMPRVVKEPKAENIETKEATKDQPVVIGKIKQNEQTGQPMAGVSDGDHFKSAVKTTGEEKAGFFANLTKRLVSKKKAA